MSARIGHLSPPENPPQNRYPEKLFLAIGQSLIRQRQHHPHHNRYQNHNHQHSRQLQHQIRQSHVRNPLLPHIKQQLIQQLQPPSRCPSRMTTFLNQQIVQPFDDESERSTFRKRRVGDKSWVCLTKASNPPLHKLPHITKFLYFDGSQLSPTQPMPHLVLQATLPVAHQYRDRSSASLHQCVRLFILRANHRLPSLL